MAKYRYLPIGSQSTYDEKYNILMIHSPILNGGSENQPSISTIFWDKRNIQSHIIRLEGNDKGTYFKNYEEMPAEIPFLEKQLQILENQFREYCKSKKNEGFAKPSLYPPEMLKQRLELEARLDVNLLELKELKKRSDEIKEKEEVIEDKKILQFGLQGAGRLRDSVLVELDGQKIIQVTEAGEEMDEALIEEGEKDETLILVIANGPYRGMAVSDYRELCKQYYQERTEADRIELEKIQNECRVKGHLVPSQLGARGWGTVDKSSLPKFPKTAKNYLQNEKS